MTDHTPTKRVLQILELLSAKGAQSIDELVDKSQLSYSSVYRILQTLQAQGYIYADQQKYFHFSTKFFGLASGNVLSLNPFGQDAHAKMQKLNYQTGETVHLGIISGDKVLYLDKIDSLHSLRMHSYIGYRAQLHCTGIGKALIAWLDAELLQVLLPKLQLTRYTANTITDHQALATQLGKIRQQGYAVDNEEHEAHLYCLAAPVFGLKGDLQAAVSLSLPAVRFREQQQEELLQYLWQCAAAISTASSYQDCLDQYRSGQSIRI